MGSRGRYSIRQNGLKRRRWLENSIVESVSATPHPLRTSLPRLLSQAQHCSETHRIKTPSRQYPLRRSIHAPPVSLQIPHDFPPAYLREHCSYLFDVGWVDGSAVRSWGRGGGFCEEEVADCDGGEGGEEEEGGNGEGLLLFWHLVGKRNIRQRTIDWSLTGKVYASIKISV